MSELTLLERVLAHQPNTRGRSRVPSSQEVELAIAVANGVVPAGRCKCVFGLSHQAVYGRLASILIGGCIAGKIRIEEVEDVRIDG